VHLDESGKTHRISDLLGLVISKNERVYNALMYIKYKLHKLKGLNT